MRFAIKRSTFVPQVTSRITLGLVSSRSKSVTIHFSRVRASPIKMLSSHFSTELSLDGQFPSGSRSIPLLSVLFNGFVPHPLKSTERSVIALSLMETGFGAPSPQNISIWRFFGPFWPFFGLLIPSDFPETGPFSDG